MATSYKTPGVYIEEIPKLPPSVAQVETAIPAFIGYTAKAEKNGESLLNIPTRITSQVDFETYFGTFYELKPGDITVTLDSANNFAVKDVSFTKIFYLHDAIRSFFDNGGGPCYITSVDLFPNVTFSGSLLSSETKLMGGLAEVEKYDEPTILVVPDAVNLGEAQFYSLQQAAIAQCAKLQDRVAVLDLRENIEDWDTAVAQFRDNIGINSLKYAAAYTPWLTLSYSRSIDYNLIRNATGVDLTTITSDSTLNGLIITANNATEDLSTTILGDHLFLRTEGPKEYKTLADRYNKLKGDVFTATDANTSGKFHDLVQFVSNIALTFPHWAIAGDPKKLKNTDLVNALNSAGKDSTNGLRKYGVNLVAFEKNADVAAVTGLTTDYTSYNDIPLADANSWLGLDVSGILPFAPTVAYGPVVTNADKRAAVLKMLPDLDAIFKGLNIFFDNLISAATTYQRLSQDALYNNHPVVSSIVKAIIKLINNIPPSAAIAGVYARVDNARGVWKAPANESLNSVSGPSVQITAEQQSSLNVDTIAGKSINAIRAFTGKGTLVWGARTLAGNDNEWRYVSVRRFFNMVEESCKKSTEPFVFEPNDANTWVKIQGMIENFLTLMWRQGALQGAKPEHAFYVAVGLGKTMTSLDILEGRLIVEIGMAVVRPAEFIILQFSHKLAES